MNNWFTCKVKYQKEDDQGRLKNITDAYLVDAMTFTEAESVIYDILGQEIHGEFLVTGISKSNISDVLKYDDSDTWHKGKISYYISDDNGKEKKVVNTVFLTAHNVRDAYDRIKESIGTLIVSFKIQEVAESNIVDVFQKVSSPSLEENNEIAE